MKRTYEPIPIPLHQRLRELRVRVLPIVVFVGIAILVALLWEERIHSPGMMGQVVADKSVVSSPDRGLFVNFHYHEFDEVREGDYLGEIVMNDPGLINARLDIIRNEIDLIEESLDPVIDDQRNRMNLEGLRVDLMNQRISLAEVRLQKQQSLADYNRTVQLYENDLISDQEYERAATELELNRTRIAEKEELITYLEESLEEIGRFGDFSTATERDPVLAAIRVQERRLEALQMELEPRPIYSPIDGVISQVIHRNGEYVDPGNQLMIIESREPTHIVGYVRQPFTIPPEVGMEVEVRTRKPGRDFFMSNIVQLGGHISLIEENLQRPGAIYESGLPVKIAIGETDGIDLTPGEIVDVVLRGRRGE
jgi:multidrug resistance efflux pump